MKNRIAVVILTAVITLLCAYELSMTFVTRSIESDAVAFATQDGKVDPVKKQFYLDSLWNEEVFLGLTFKEIKSQEVKLGLDLQGGMNVTMEVSTPDILVVLSNNNADPGFRAAIAEVRKTSVTENKPIVPLFVEAMKKHAPGKPLAPFFSTKANGDRINPSTTDQEVIAFLNENVEKTIDRSFEILRNRIDKFGTIQPNIQKLQGTNRIQIELPGVDNPERVRKLLQGAAKLEFLEVYSGEEFFSVWQSMNAYLAKQEEAAKAGGSQGDLSAFSTDSSAQAAAATDTNSLASALGGDSANKLTDSATAKAAEKDTSSLSKGQSAILNKLIGYTGTNLFVRVKDSAKVNRLLKRPDVAALKPSDLVWLWGVKAQEGREGDMILELHAVKKGREGAPLEGDVITRAVNDFDPMKGTPMVSMNMNAKGASKWKKLTAANVGKQIAISLDDRVYSAPVVNGEIPNGSSQISGNFTVEEAKDLATVLISGRMPVPTRIVEEVVVGPSLGQESINQGVLSIVAGLLSIILFMVAFYAQSGVVAVVAVFLNIFLILGILVPWGAVLTLPGIAGIVLTVGMAVDANVLINERIKDELREGASLVNAVERGYKAASVSIWDANLTTMIAGVVLLYFGSGPVKGFATTLLIGIGTSLFTSIYVTRFITEFRLSRGTQVTFYTPYTRDFMRGINLDFVGQRKKAYIGSALLIVVLVISMLTYGFNKGVDFAGGWTYIVQSDKAVSSTDIRQALATPLESAPEVKTYGDGNKFKITTTYQIASTEPDAADKVQAKVEEGLKAVSGSNFTLLSSSKVGPTVAADITEGAIWATIFSLLGVFAYIWARFYKWSYAMGATIAVLHDTLIILGLFSLLKDVMPFSMDLDQNFLAALLTTIGYQVNDTVVIMDRIREVFREAPAGSDRKKLINEALNLMFPRTVITATTVFLVVLILLVFGGETLKGMSFALLLGVITGTYSTIYIAVPFLIDAVSKKEEVPVAQVVK